MTHSNRVRLSKLSLGLIAALAAASAFAQTTSSGVSGVVTGADGSPVAGAEVTITHVESGTVSRATTDANGRYTAQGLRVGGPYSVTVTKAGGGTDTEDNIYLGLNQVSTVNAQLKNDVSTLETVSVTASRNLATFNSDNKGLGTSVGARDLKAAPSAGRSIADIARLDPRVTVSDRGEGAISANGQNNRFNTISVDGVGVGDPFGLNSNGMPYIGSPISPDTIEAYNISTANFDVATDTVGASIDAVTKSGTNDFHGSVYYAYRNAKDFVGNLDGKEYGGYDRDWTGGFTLGGPIVKDKLFFFVNYEKQKTIGLGADSTNALANGTISQADLDRVINAANALGLKPGTFSGGNVDLEDTRYLAKLDWNVNDDHRISLTHNRTKETQPIVQGNSGNSVGLTSYWYTKNSDTKNTVLQFFDNWTDNFSTEAKIGYSRFQQVRSVDTQQPQIFVDLGFSQDPVTGKQTGSAPYIDLGEDQYSHYNVLDIKTWRAFFAGTWNLGSHAVKGGVDFQQNQIYNLFGRTQFGAYTFYGIDNFEKGIYGSYNIYQPAPGLDIDDVAAQWKLKQYGLFLQDSWQVTDRFSLQYGLRVDIAKTGDKPRYNALVDQTFGVGPDGTVVVDYAPGSNVKPIRNDSTIDGRKLWEPRLSFNYQLDTERMTQIRGGAGLFQSNPPTVWMTNPYQNNGVTTTTYQVYNDYGDQPGVGNTLPVFSPDPFNQNLPPATSSQMAVDTIDPDFQLPSVWKYSLAFDREMPFWQTVFSAEYQHIAVKNGVWYQSLNIGAPTGTLPDGRNQYWKTPGEASFAGDARANQDRRFASSGTYLTNTDKGHSDNLTLSLKKPFANDWAATVGVTFSDAFEVNPGTSSQANSNFSNNAWVNPNDGDVGRANRVVRQRLNASLNWEHKFFGDYATGVGLFYDGHSGNPYSWTFGNDANGDSFGNGTDLVYIPNPGDVELRQANGSAATAAQQQQFYDYIKSNDYLRKHQGSIATRNGAYAGWVNDLDISFRQELPGFMKGHKGEVRLDIYNFLNLLNSDWGQTTDMGFYNTRNLADYGGVNADGQYIYKIYTDANGNYLPEKKTIYDAGTYTKTNVVSRWSALITLRYTF